MSATPTFAGVRHHPLGTGPLLAWGGWAQAAVAALSAGAGIIHGVEAVNHLGSAGAAAFFAVAAIAQLAWAGAVVVSGARWVLAAGVVGNAPLVAVWLVSRTVGVPVGAHAGEMLSVGLADGISQLLQALLIAGAGLVLARAPARWVVQRAFAGASIVVLLAVVPLTAAGAGVIVLDEDGDHSHADDHEHEHAESDDGHAPPDAGS